MTGRFAPLAALVFALVTWEIIERLVVAAHPAVPAPSAIADAFVRSGRVLWLNAQPTVFEAGFGFAFGSLAGVVLATLLFAWSSAEAALFKVVVTIHSIPLLAVAPLLVIWFGFGIQTVIASAFVASVFPVIANTLSGILSTDLPLRDLFRLYGASAGVTLVKLRFPAALPQILTGLRVASGLAVIGAIVGEFIGGQGLGSVVDVARTQQRVDKVFAAVLLASVLGLGLFGLINLISALTLRRWHASEQGA